jgi:hypothetical protein
VRLVRDAAARVEAHRPRRQPGREIGREVACGAVVAGDDEHRPGLALGKPRDEERAQRLADERAAAIAVQGDRVGVLVEVLEEGSEGHRRTQSDRARCPAGPSSSVDPANVDRASPSDGGTTLGACARRQRAAPGTQGR